MLLKMFNLFKNSDPTIDMAPEQAKARLDAGGAILLDVREAWERDIAAIPGALWIPMDELDEKVTGLDTSKEIIVYCKSGGRSLRAARFLRNKGFERVWNLKGGIDAWRETVDKGLRKY